MFQIDVAVRVENSLRHRSVVFRDAQAFEVSDLDCSVIDDSPSRFSHANAKIQVIAVHEESRIKDGNRS